MVELSEVMSASGAKGFSGSNTNKGPAGFFRPGLLAFSGPAPGVFPPGLSLRLLPLDVAHERQVLLVALQGQIDQAVEKLGVG